MNDDPNNDLDLVRETLQNSELSEMFSPAVTAQIDALRASVHEQLKERNIKPGSREFELIWMVAGGTVGQLIASDNVTQLFYGIHKDDERGAIAARLFWASGISAYPTEKLPG